MRPAKVPYLDGLRGIAAMQVVLLHFVTGFLPDAAQHAWLPLRVLFDGHTAVYVFFLISGAVLTPWFARPGAFLGKLGKRVVRLGLPVAAAAVIATVLLAAWPDAHLRAAALTGSAWLAMDSSGAPTLPHLAREIGLDSLLLGYREATLFAPLAGRLPPMEHSLDAPFWSLPPPCSDCRKRLNALGRAGAVPGVVRHAADVPVRAGSARVHTPSPAQRGRTGEGVPRCISAATRHRAMRQQGLVHGGHASPMARPRRACRAAQPVPVPEPTRCRRAVLWRAGVRLGLAAAGLRSLSSPGAPVVQHLSSALPDLVHPWLLMFIGVAATLSYAALVTVMFAVFIGLTLFAAIVFERWIDRPAIALSRRAGAFHW
jgi:hypothetical protein